MTDTEFTRAELERLQTEQAYQADLIAALNTALSSQQIELIELRQTLRLLESRLRELRDSVNPRSADGEIPAEPLPPHY